MLVIISDLHLTDGSSGETISTGAFRALRERLRDMAYDASWRGPDKYEPIEKVDIVLLGDILDIIRSDKWNQSEIRPYSDRNAEFFEKVKEINEAILTNNQASLEILKSLSQGQAITLPPAENDKPKEVSRDPSDSARIPVQVDIHYMVGNHDWFYHLKEEPYNQIREQVIDAMGLANAPNQPFPHEPQENEQLRDVLNAHQVFARHGDIYDSFNFEEDRSLSSLGDAIVVDLLNRFPQKVEEELGDTLPSECLTGLKEIDNVRPLLAIPIWIDGLLRRTCPLQEQIKKVKDVWDTLADEFLDSDFVKAHDIAFKWDNADKLQLGLKFSKSISFRMTQNVTQKIDNIVETFWGDSKFYKKALSERAFKNRTARFIVYGHTHHQEIVPLDASYNADGAFNQIYFNSGTWRRVHELAQLNPDDQEFMGYHVMTYLAFFKEGERKGRPFEVWNGALGV